MCLVGCFEMDYPFLGNKVFKVFPLPGVSTWGIEKGFPAGFVSGGCSRSSLKHSYTVEFRSQSLFLVHTKLCYPCTGRKIHLWVLETLIFEEIH